uniref:CCHC-type domain-containing protein n=1 Tax=Fagus sylvatica TaxID=28930 RepID=A0A2N9H783_FAGSY
MCWETTVFKALQCKLSLIWYQSSLSLTSKRSRSQPCLLPQIKPKPSISILSLFPLLLRLLLLLNITAQINEKLTPSTFPQWRAQFEALLIGYDLLDYVNGAALCPSSDGTSSADLIKTHWVRQDKLILSAILASTSPTITPLIATAKTSSDAWKKLHNLYASHSRTRAMQLKEELTLIQRGNREIAAPIRARETSLAFEELHDLLVGHESYLRRLEAATQQLVASANYTHRTKQGDPAKKFSRSSGQHRSNNSASSQNNVQRDGRRSYHGSGQPNNSNRRYQPKCQICDQLGHIAKSCPQLHSNGVTVNCAQTSTGKDKNWLLDSAASHNITGDLANLSVHSEYDGTDEVILGDGSGLAVSHIGSLALHSPNRTFILRDTLCVPNLCKNLISVHHLTKQNNVFVELHPFHFFVKDKITGAILIRGACDNGVYTFPGKMVASSSPMVANVHERTFD